MSINYLRRCNISLIQLQAQQRNMTYAAMYLDRVIGVFNRQLPISMQHINQIAVISDRGRIVNLMRGQGSVYHRLVPSSVTAEKDVTRQFQHPVFSTNGKYVAFSEMYFKNKGVYIHIVCAYIYMDICICVDIFSYLKKD